MPAEAWEIDGRRRWQDTESPSAQTVWAVSGASSYLEAVQALADAPIPSTYTFPSGRVAFLNGFPQVEEVGPSGNLLIFNAEYTARKDPEFNQVEYEFEVSAPTDQHFQSITTRKFAPAGKQAPEFGGAIGIRNGQVQGMPALTPVSTFSITKHWPVAVVTLQYQAAIQNTVGKVCNVLFSGRAAGTVKLMGVRGRASGDKFPISYQFGFRPNSPPFAFDRVNVTGVLGWELLDPYYVQEADTTAKRIVERVRAVYVHQVAETDSFSALNL